MTRRFIVSGDGTPEGDKAAELAQKLLDSLPDAFYRETARAVAHIAAQPVIDGYALPTDVQMEAVLRPIVDRHLNARKPA